MRINSGGHIAQIKFFNLAKSICQAYAATYKEKDQDDIFLDDVLKQDVDDEAIYVVHWGPDVQHLLKILSNKHIVYFAHSSGWNIRIPSEIPIVAVSKHTQAFWGKHAPNSLIYYLPNILSENYTQLQQHRSIDVLVQKRKSSRYLLEELVPALKQSCNVEVLDSWVDDLAEVFNRTKVYLYDSTEHWHQIGASEGFGLPPLEAMACGCTVFSSVTDALSDYLDPGFNCYKLRVHTRQYDIDRIAEAVKLYNSNHRLNQYAELIAQYREPYIKMRFTRILGNINEFFDCTKGSEADIPVLETPSNYSQLIASINNIIPSSLKKYLKSSP
jgi:glycosyltransferase involved in cell wall biosynthesis